MPAMLFLHSMCPCREQCPAHWAGFSSFSSSLKVKCQTDQCDIALFKRHFRSVLCFYRHGIFIICRQNTIKFLFTVDCTICSYLYFFSHAADIIFFFFQRSAKSRRADLKNIGVLNEIFSFISRATASQSFTVMPPSLSI